MNTFLRRAKKWFSTPQTTKKINRSNFINVQIEAVWMGITFSVLSFIPVFLTRLNASNFQIGLITSMPAIAGLFLSIPIGQFISRYKDIKKLYFIARILLVSRFGLIGIIPFIFQENAIVSVSLIVLAIATIPMTLGENLFSIVMSSIAGPHGRFELMTRRWSIYGIVSSITLFFAGFFLDAVAFPINYQIVLIVCSITGIISSLYITRYKITFKPSKLHHENSKSSLNLSTVFKNKKFVGFLLNRFLFIMGLTMTIPLLPVFYVSELGASDSLIGLFNMAKSAILFIGYYFWMSYYRKKGGQIVLVLTTLGLALFPIVLSFQSSILLVTILLAISGIFQAGLDLVLFDELFKTFPLSKSPYFVSISQTAQYLSIAIAPFISSFIADSINIKTALLISGSLQFLGFLLFFFPLIKSKIAK